jgi:hypothetical protein
MGHSTQSVIGLDLGCEANPAGSEWFRPKGGGLEDCSYLA